MQTQKRNEGDIVTIDFASYTCDTHTNTTGKIPFAVFVVRELLFEWESRGELIETIEKNLFQISLVFFCSFFYTCRRVFTTENSFNTIVYDFR